MPTTPVRQIDEPPELYSIDGAVPDDVLQARVEWLQRNPVPVGVEIDLEAERRGVSVAEAAKQFGVREETLHAVINGQLPMTPDLAARIEAAGWTRAEYWMRAQTEYDAAAVQRHRLAAANSHGATVTEERAPEPAAAIAG